MGRSKFPGKPSKSVMKERIRVLYKNENGRIDKDANKRNNSGGSNCNEVCLQAAFIKGNEQQEVELKSPTEDDASNKSTNNLEDRTECVKPIYCVNNQNLKHSSDDTIGRDGKNDDSSSAVYSTTGSTLNPRSCNTENIKNSLTHLDKLTKKKTVTFKNVLETSDDTLVIKKVHNSLNNGPLISIMKKECLTSQRYLTRGDVIVRPSRLTEILKNNENIDKTKSLSFRSSKVPDLSGNKNVVDQAAQYLSPNGERSSKHLFLGKDNERNGFEPNKRNLKKVPQESNDDKGKLSLDKWKLCSKSDNDAQDQHEYRKKSPKKKDVTSHNKIILRQPRLHFEPQKEIPAKGKQSILNNTNNANLLTPNLCTHSVCGVCNTMVNSKNLQNRKYGIIACDACRKFISKITKKTVSSSTNPLTVFKIQCSKRDGECVISSLPKNSVKSFKKIYDERCSACWLRKCIKSFHFPSGHKFRLNAILSEPNKSKIDVKTVNKSFDSLSSSSVNTFKYGAELLSENDFANKTETSQLTWKAITSGGVVELSKFHHGEFTLTNNIVETHLDSNISFEAFTKCKQSQCVQPVANNGICSSGKHNRLYSNSILNKKIESVHCKSIEQQLTNSISTPEYPKRQKIDFKGPRVKHVCRSASIALGQQIATFSNEDEEISKIVQAKPNNTESAIPNSLLGNIYFSGNDQENCSQKPVEDIKDLRNQLDDGEKTLKQGCTMNGIEIKRHAPQNPFVSVETNQKENIKDRKPFLFKNTLSHGKNNCQLQKSAQKYSVNKNVFMLAHRNISSLSKRNLMRITKARNSEKKSKYISIDFWDNYVPAEVSQTGFGLILTEPAPICAICFLCGSMDLEYLLFCASCCEPYHSYCIQEELNSNCTIFQKNIAGNTVCENDVLNQLNWVCPRCTICYTCNMSSGEKIKCQKCRKNYHSTCMGTSKGLLGADRPLICRSCLKCQTCSTTKVSKYVGNQPICMQCFKFRRSESRCPLCNNLFDNILDLIILECGICERLIHVKCEGLTEEQSNLLSNLPGDIKFVCKKCSLANDNAKTLAKEWRDAVYEELKTGLLDVLKLLSRSRQANVLKINLMKNCPCGLEQNKKERIVPNENYTISHITEGLKGSKDCILNYPPESTLYYSCLCSNSVSQQSKLNNALSLFDVKKKIINGEYVSLFDFNADMNDIIMPLKNDELILAYKEILSEKFSWFQNETKTCTDALEEDMFDSCNYSFPLDEIVIEDQSAATKLPQTIGKIVSYLKQEKDNRVCLFCSKEGDGGVLQESRLLYYGYNTWVHANCAIWSSDVYEEFDGTLQNVQKSLNQGNLKKCTLCKTGGATIKCIHNSCCNYYHFQCARKTECVFKSDKAVYCSTHCPENRESNSLTKETFTVFRPLYIEFDKSRRKFVEPSKVQFMVGSLSVIQLGTVYSKFSDTSEAIVPINFICTRLYWSCREPWKLVKYSVRTMIQHSSVTFANDIGINFTVDHSNNVNLVESGLSQIASWHNTLTREETFESSLHHEYLQLGNRQFTTDIDNPGETISDACVEEEPQNNSDLLPPEIKDAIFEDLPHDILDGISMLDIFPKLMIYEDLIAIEGKSDNMLTSDPTENSALQILEDSSSYYSLNKQESNNKCSYNIMSHMEDVSPPTVHFAYPKRELQRSNSEVFLRNVEGYRSQQRSSSVAWSCKFDSTRRYFAKGPSDVGLSESKIFNSNYKKIEEGEDYKSNIKKNIEFDDVRHVAEVKKDKFKLMQLDGTDDTVMGYISTRVTNTPSKSPVKCDRCQCTYRTFDSFQRHLATCEQISTSESETETSSLPPDASQSTIVFQDESVKNNLQIYHNQLGSNQLFQTPISIVNETNVISSDRLVPQNIYVTNSTDYEDGFYVNIDKPGANNDNKNINSNSNNYGENIWQNISGDGANMFNNKCTLKNKKVKSNFTNSNSKANTDHYKIYAKPKQETIVAPEAINTINNKTEYSPQGKHSYLQFLNQQLVLNNQYSQKDQQSQQQQYVVIQQSVGNNQPLFIQQVANQNTIPQNMFPVVLSNNSVQYASIPTSTNPLVQGSILQTDQSGNVILSSGIQMLSMPSLQLTSQTTPQLVGTFNQQPPLHLGTNQMLIGGTGTMELMQNPNQVLLAAPPVYYGLETIVQNTVMSSQQFVSTAMQGVLSQNASFSATTTQVFQSSKFEPVNDAPSGYVVLNNPDGTALVVPQTTLVSGFMNTNNSHDFQNNYSQDLGNICGTHHTTFLQQPQQNNVLPLIPTLADISSVPVENDMNQIQAPVNLENNSHIAPSGKQTIQFASKVENIMSPKNAFNIPCSSSISNSTCDMTMAVVEDKPPVIKDYDNGFNVNLTCIDSDTYGTQSKSADINKLHPNNRVQVKPKVTQKYFKRSKVCKNTQISSKIMYKNILQKELKLNRPNETVSKTLNNKSKIKVETHHKTLYEDNMQTLPSFNANHRKTCNDRQDCSEIENTDFESHIEAPDSYLGPNDSTQNIVPRSNNRNTSQPYLINAAKQLTTVSFGNNFNNVPTNIVAPILQTHSSNNTTSRPTNRVLPMQSIQKPIDKTKLRSLTLKRPSFRDNANRYINNTSDVETKNKAIPVIQNVEQICNEMPVTEQNQLELKNTITTKNEILKTKTNSNFRENQLNILKELPNLNDSFDSKKSDVIFIKDNPVKSSGKDDQEDLKEDIGDNILNINISSDDKSNKTVIEGTEDLKDTDLLKAHTEAFTQLDCLDVGQNVESPKKELKCKTPKQFATGHHSCQAISGFPSKKRPENDDFKKKYSEPYLIYEIQSEDGFSYKSKSIADVWEKVFESVQCARRLHGLSSLPIGPFADMCGVQMIGLKTNALKYLIEQLPGTEDCTKYTPKYHKNVPSNTNSENQHQEQEDLLENCYGAVRCAPFTKRSEYDLFSWLASRHRKQPKQIFVQPSDTELIARRCTANLPMAMKYRTLKETCKHNVGVFRSLIHGRGLFCIKDIEAGEMVIEYAGELIRSTLTDKRERFYDSRGIGCYMFKIDDNFVVDATMRGNAARFINHSCEPNCYSKVVDILGHKHIIIFSLRRIVQGEELTYDYKFPFEDVKIPCSCGSKKCRKYLN